MKVNGEAGTGGAGSPNRDAGPAGLAALPAVLSGLAKRCLRGCGPLRFTVERAERHSGAKGHEPFSASMKQLRERETMMEAIIRFRERLMMSSGQTMTEYALIMATIVIVLISFYNTSGTLVKALVNQVDPLL